MQPAPSSFPAIEPLNLQDCPLADTAPIEIHGGRDRGCGPGDDYLFQGHRYLYDDRRDVLVREDVNAWIATQR
jgi:hypothetical protein